MQSPVAQDQQSASDLVFPYATCPLSNKCSDGPYLLYPLSARMVNFTPGVTPVNPIGGDTPVPETGEARGDAGEAGCVSTSGEEMAGYGPIGVFRVF